MVNGREPTELGNSKKTTKRAKTEDDSEVLASNPWLGEWDKFDESRYEFVTWVPTNDSRYVVQIKFIESSPTEFTNKWGRQQWKILVIQNKGERWLSGGKRLFEAIKRLAVEFNLPPNSIPGNVRIYRIGRSVESRYTAEVIEDAEKTEKTN